MIVTPVKRVIYLSLIKFYQYPVSTEVIKDVTQKIERLDCPRYFSHRPVLIHVNGVSDKVLESQYFAEIIDFGQLLKSE